MAMRVSGGGLGRDGSTRTHTMYCIGCHRVFYVPCGNFSNDTCNHAWVYECCHRNIVLFIHFWCILYPNIILMMNDCRG